VYGSSAEQNKRFLLLFLEKEEYPATSVNGDTPLDAFETRVVC
jgi:hypothetical protein